MDNGLEIKIPDGTPKKSLFPIFLSIFNTVALSSVVKSLILCSKIRFSFYLPIF